MYRENMIEMIKGADRLFVPKNSGFDSYLPGLYFSLGFNFIPRINGGVEDINGTMMEFVRAEDIPKRVMERMMVGEVVYGLTGDDLYDEARLREPKMDDWVELVNTYDWFDKSARFLRSALCLMSYGDSIYEAPEILKVGVNKKYELTSKQFLDSRLQMIRGNGFKFYELNSYSGGVENTVVDGTNDCCIEIVYSGSTVESLGLELIGDPIRFSDLSLIGPKKENLWGKEYQQIVSRKTDPTGSLTSRLLQDKAGIDAKLEEEYGEYREALETGVNISGEALDLIYSTMLGLASSDVKWSEIEYSLRKRWS